MEGGTTTLQPYMKIIGYEYDLELDKTIEQIGQNAGLINFDDMKINIASDLNPNVKASVLIHEVIEAINYHLELDLKHPQIMALEVGFHQVLSENGVDLSPLLKEE
jgi:hypothetical protein